MRRALTFVIQVSAIGVIYYFIARFGLDLASVHPGATAISPAAGFAFAAVLVGGYRAVPAIFAAAFFVYALSSGPSYVAAATAAGNALEDRTRYSEQVCTRLISRNSTQPGGSNGTRSAARQASGRCLPGSGVDLELFRQSRCFHRAGRDAWALEK